MTENKRFNFNLTFGEDEHKGLIFFNGKIMKTIDVVYLLNKLSNENEQLKERISELKFLLELAKLHTQVAEGNMDKFVELKFE